jgi:predicted transposase/invertase (TIGR01784 family)
MRYLDPKNDLTFKKIFCEHPDILMDLLNSLLDFRRGNFIKSIQYLPAELPPLNPLKKNSIVDVRCTDNYDRQFIVEMQMLWTDSFTSRVMFNASKAFVKQLDKGLNYSKLHPVYSVNLVNEIFLPQKEGYYHDYRVVNSAEAEHVLEGLSFLFIELPKVKEHNLPKSLNRALWLRFFTEIKDETEAISAALAANPKIKDAIDILQESAFTSAELEQYDKYWDMISTERTIREDMTQKLEAAQKELEIANEQIVAANEKTALAEQKAAEERQQKEIAEQKTALAEQKAAEERQQKEIAEQKIAEAHQRKIEGAKMLWANNVPKEIIATSYQISLEELEKWLD